MIYTGSILLSLAAGAIGSLATVPNIPSWYAGLAEAVTIKSENDLTV